MSKRKFYRNFNKRKKFNGTRVVTVVLCLAIIGTYTYINLKDKNFMDKLGNINMVSSIRKASIWGGLKNIFDKSNVITSSNIERALIKPSNMWTLASSCSKSNLVLLIITSFWWSIYFDIIDFKPNVFGVPLSITKKIIP